MVPGGNLLLFASIGIGILTLATPIMGQIPFTQEDLDETLLLIDRDWFVTYEGQIKSISEQIEVKVTSDDPALDICDEAAIYCQPLQISENAFGPSRQKRQVDGQCPNGPPVSCSRTNCTVRNPTQPSDYLIATSDLPPVNSTQLNCGQITSSATADGLMITIDRVGCSTGASVSVPIRTPTVGFFQSTNNSSTVTFKISIAQRPENSTNITFLTITAIGEEVIHRIRLGFLKTGEIYRGEIQTPFGSSTTVANFVDVTTEIEVAIQVYRDRSTNAWVQRIYFNGELSLLGYTGQFIQQYRMDLQVDQDNLIMFKNINVYEGVLLDSEIYELATGKAVEYRDAPECQCPRSTPNDYGFYAPNGQQHLSFAASNYNGIRDCVNDIPSETATAQSRLVAYDSSISSIVGDGSVWISRHTNTLEFTIGFNQMMTVHGLVMQTYNVPGTMEIIYQGGVGGDDSLIYIADDCEEAFNMEATIPLKAVKLNIQPQRRKRNVVSKHMAKCFNWESIISSVSSFDFASTIIAIPVFGLEDSHLLDSAAYTAERITVRMSDHRNASYPYEQFYSFVSGFRSRFQDVEPGIIIHGKPFCNGQPFNFLSPNLTFEGYYSFINEPSSECNCENSPFTGPYCTTCPAETEGIPSFISNGECFFCNCSSLSTSPTCNRDTGQCACREDMDETFTGQQCYWYTSSVDPLYGPIAGGTVITVEGYFTSVDLISDLYLRVNRSANQEGGAELITEDNFLPYETVSFGLTPQRSEEIDNQGPDLFFNFVYLPNPIIANITPRQMTLSGGTRATVTGQFIDSVAYPKMTVYLRKNGLIINTLETSCEVINGTMMECETPKLTPVYCEIVNCDNIGPRVPPPLPSSSSTASPTTSFITPPTNTTIITGSPAAALRRKRQTPDIITMQPEGISDNYLNDREGVTFTLGWKFDGLKEYQDLTGHPNTTIREQAVIFVFRDPVFDRFPNLNNLENTIAYKGCNPDCFAVAISGDNMEQGAIQSDYIIEVGISKVGVAKLSDNALTFFPPPEKPGIDPGHNTGNNDPHVRVILGNQKELIGFIRYPTDNAVAIGVGVAVGVLVIAAVVIGIVCFIRKKKLVRKFEAEKREQDVRYVSAGGGKLAEKEPLFPEIDPDLKAKVERCKIPQEKLQMSQVVGKGNFGRVFRGNLVLPSGKSRVVAVKSLKDSNELSLDELEDFLREATIMIDFQHQNILSLIGVVWEAGDRPLVVLPYMECGDIRKLVKSTDVTLTLGDLLHFCLQVSNGMAYLENQKFVHRDLAARNCMVDSESKVKVADFGLSRDIYEKQYYKIVDQNRPLPIKWMAIEAITQGLFTSKSDVWSFGILCWEILTRGSMPYPAVENYHVRAHVERGERLDQPAGCPDVIFKLMSQCWYENPDDRPSFAQISEFLSTVLQTAGKGAEEKEENYHREYTKDIPQNYLDMSGETADANYIDVLPDNDDYLQPADAISSSNQSTHMYIKPSDIPKPSAAAADDDYAKAELVQPEAKNESGYMNA